jgi:Mor family transcriptional regulator
MRARSRYPELFEDLIAKLAPVLKKCGVSADKIPKIALAVADLIRSEWGGSTLYFPIGVSVNADELARRVYADWNGRNTRELAIELRVSGRRIHQLYERGKRLARTRD